ncbi:MAG: penicillin-binding protein 2 [Chloroflexota bacterium]|nr:penicillin-binding protein 2 [Chloroflexota bacterium]
MMDDSHTLGQRRRIAWLTLVLLATGLVLVVRVAFCQLMPQEEVLSFSLQGGDMPDVVPVARGNIRDATGHYVVASTVSYDISVSPELLSAAQKEALVPELARLLGKQEREISHMLSLTGTVLLGKGVSPAVQGQIEKRESAAAFKITPRFRRVYPDGALASSVLGFVNYEGEALYGLEEYYDHLLCGTQGEWYGVRDPWGEQILANLVNYREARDGATLVLTLDRNVQHMAEQILRRGIEENKATSGNIIVLDPRTGGVLAMANYPTYAPGDYGNVDSLQRYVNTSISSIYEPGSVFKPLTLAAALDAHLIRPTDSYDDRGEIIVGTQRIRNADRKSHGPTTMVELLAYSRNVGAAYVATLLGEARFYEMVRRFGFGEVTGIDLAHEEDGILRVPGDSMWHKSDLATNSFGQGIAVTPIQVAVAYAAIANDGILMRPHVVREIRRGEHVEVIEPFPVRRVISSEASQDITTLMVDSMELGMKKAVLPGYVLAGKSGTSEIATLEGYMPETVIASFVGFGPVPDARFVVLTKFDRPREGYWGTDVAAPEFRRMCKYLVDYYGIPPTR